MSFPAPGTCPICGSENLSSIGKVEWDLALCKEESYIEECDDCWSAWERPTGSSRQVVYSVREGS